MHLSPNTGLLSCLLSFLVAGSLEAQCSVVLDIVPGTGSSSPRDLTPAYGIDLYFSAGGSLGTELYRWNPGTGPGLVRDIRAGSQGSSPEGLAWGCTSLGPRLFFSAAATGIDREPWISDGTAAGTSLLLDVRPGTRGSVPSQFTPCNGLMLFRADDGTHGYELWSSDGTTNGTQLLADLYPGSLSSSPDQLVAATGRVYFVAEDPMAGRELFVSDGTPQGTQLLRDIHPGPNLSGIALMTAIGSRLYFTATDPVHGTELWTSDGTPAGTQLVLDIQPNTGSSSPTELTACNGLLYFVARDPSSGSHALWRSDGTAQGTSSFTTPAMVRNPAYLGCSEARLFFAGDTVNEGNELWVTDGTTNGTHLVVDARAGMASSSPQNLVSIGTGVCYHALGSNGRELWFSDGTSQGTRELCDLVPGPNGSAPFEFQACHGRLFFTVDTPSLGLELHWVPSPGATQARLGEGSRPSRPRLHVVDDESPVLGRTITLEAQGPNGSFGAVYLGLPSAGALPLPGIVNGGCDWIGFLGGAVAELGTTLTSAWSSSLPLPSQSILNGVVVHVQALWLNPTASPPLQVSNGLQLALGLSSPS